VSLLLANKWEYSDAGVLDRTHLRFFVRETAIRLMSPPGLEVVTVQPSPINRRRDRLLNAATLGCLRSFFTLQYFIVARKVPINQVQGTVQNGRARSEGGKTW
jgi:hypothetical protein